jgi:hypothetical protein
VRLPFKKVKPNNIIIWLHLYERWNLG